MKTKKCEHKFETWGISFGVYLTITPLARVGYEMVSNIYPTSPSGIIIFLKNAQKMPAVQSLRRRREHQMYLWYMAYELIYHCLLTNQNPK